MAGRKKGEHNLIGCILMPDAKNRKYRYRYKLPGIAQKQKTFNTLEEAKKFQLTLTKRIIDTEEIYLYDSNVRNMTVSEFFEEYCELTIASERYGAYGTTKTYTGYLRKHFIPVCGDDKMDSIDFKKVKIRLESVLTGENKDKVHLTAKTTKEIVNSIIHFLKMSENKYGFLYDQEKRKEIKESLFKVINNYKHDAVKSESPNFFNDLQPWQYNRIMDDLFCFDDKADRRNYFFAISFIKNTGIRAEELAFKWEDYNDRRNTQSLIVNKSIRKKPGEGLIIDEFLKTSSAYRNIELNDEAIWAIENMRLYQQDNNIDTDLIFCTINGQPIDSDNLRKFFKRGAIRVNEQIKRENVFLDYDEQNREVYLNGLGLHSLRKLYAYTKVQEGMDLWQISSLMGHSQTDVTFKKYYQLKDTLSKDWFNQEYNKHSESKLTEEESERIKKRMRVPGLKEEHNPTWLALREMAFLSGREKTPEIEKRILELSQQLLDAQDKVQQEILEERKKYKYLFHR